MMGNDPAVDGQAGSISCRIGRGDARPQGRGRTSSRAEEGSAAVVCSERRPC